MTPRSAVDYRKGSPPTSSSPFSSASSSPRDSPEDNPLPSSSDSVDSLVAHLNGAGLNLGFSVPDLDKQPSRPPLPKAPPVSLSTLKGSSAQRAVSEGASSIASSSPGQPSKHHPHTDKLPVDFDPEPESWKRHPLPVRLGLVPPTAGDLGQEGASQDAFPHPAGASEWPARFGHGFYFCIPPPTPVQRPLASPSTTALTRPGGDRSASATLARQPLSAVSSLGSRPSEQAPKSSSQTSENPGHHYAYVSDWTSRFESGLYASMAAMAGASSAMPIQGRRSRANSSAAKVSPPAKNEKPPPLPTAESKPRPPDAQKPDLPWDPSSYFKTCSFRSKGKVRERRHHAFPRSEVPYWLGYDRESLEAESYAHITGLLSLHSHTLIKFPEDRKPARVLDLGCGTGAWCLDLAREWPDTEFIGLDVCPIQSDLSVLGEPELARRISWVVANFLRRLPFPDDSFDYVHIRFVQFGVPEDRWPDLVSEAERVLAPGGVLEILEGNYIFYGRPHLVDESELGSRDQTQHHTVKIKNAKRSSAGSDGPNYDPIEIVVERMLHRRFINPTPLSIIPSTLLTGGLTNVALGNPRHIPIRAESSAARRKAARERSGHSGSSKEASAEEAWEEKFTKRKQIGRPLNSSFHIDDMDLFRALNLIHTCQLLSSSRALIWEEAEAEKHEILSQRRPAPNAANGGGVSETLHRRIGQGHPLASQPFAHPWESREQFEEAMDRWFNDIMVRADLASMIDRHLGWDHGDEELTVEGRKQAERKRKMSKAPLPLLADPLSSEPKRFSGEDEESEPATPDRAAVTARDERDEGGGGGSRIELEPTGLGEGYVRNTEKSQSAEELSTPLQSSNPSPTSVQRSGEGSWVGGSKPPFSSSTTRSSRRPTSSGGVSLSKPRKGRISEGWSKTMMSHQPHRTNPNSNMIMHPSFVPAHIFGGNPTTIVDTLTTRSPRPPSIESPTRSARSPNRPRSSGSGGNKRDETSSPPPSPGTRVATRAQRYANSILSTTTTSSGASAKTAQTASTNTANTSGNSTHAAVAATSSENVGLGIGAGDGTVANSTNTPSFPTILFDPSSRKDKETNRVRISKPPIPVLGFYDVTGFIASAI
ncbi:hypothetical protein IE53DRAFT_368224 [Violaceomyces palustris]|uniref:Uncharacterized protein n=1 Tax=Violaceomyces palustris TaxID=1673888 RepID=A0ACD0NZC8_9BASI|nr:hypothetical protein IE53DRAFT_368224 [Violaceomyces palustris]